MIKFASVFMWEKFAVYILRRRFLVSSTLILFSLLFAYFSTRVEIAYNNPKFIPDDDPDQLNYVEFRKTFGDDGNTLIVGIDDEKLRKIEFFQTWYRLTQKLNNKKGVKTALSLCNLPTLQISIDTSIWDKDTFLQERFVSHPLLSKIPSDQNELDLFFVELENLKIYDGILFKKKKNFSLLAISIEQEILDTKKRIKFINQIESEIKEALAPFKVKAHFSGLPFIRNVMSQKIKSELLFFTFLSILITSLILVFFFRSFKVLFFCLLVVVLGIVWSLGITSLLGYKISVFISILPPLIVVIGIANCIYLLNKYHDEYKKHKNKIKALQRVISKVGRAVFFTNLTTATGFGVFFFTGTKVLQEFGIVAFVSILSLFGIALVVIPVVFSYLSPPSQKQMIHLDKKALNRLLSSIHKTLIDHRRIVYLISLFLFIIALAGIFRVRAIGYMLEDISEKDQLHKDLKFFEKNINGVMPFELIIHTKPEGIKEPRILGKIDQLTNKISNFKEFSKPISISQSIQFCRQIYHDGDTQFYKFPGLLELSNLVSLMPTNKNQTGELSALVNDDFSKARISLQMKDIGSTNIIELRNRVQQIADTIFNMRIRRIFVEEPDSNNDFNGIIETSYEPVEDSKRVNIYSTGTSVTFLKGNNYLIKNLLVSIAIAFLIISFIMAILFRSFRMILIALVPNFIPLAITGGIMGFSGIHLKPSSVIIFSVAFGIAVDFTIHFLSKYLQELKRNNGDIQKSVRETMNETGVSMIYTAVILFFGFIIFSFSSFGGTIILGIFTSITLTVSLLSNLFLLPSLLVGYDRRKRNK